MPWWETPVCRSVRSKAPPSEEGLSFPNVTVKCNRWSCRSLHGDEHLHPQIMLQILEVTAHAWVRSLSTTGYVLLFRQKAAYKERLLCVCWEGVHVQHLSLAQGQTSGHGMDGAAFDRSRGQIPPRGRPVLCLTLRGIPPTQEGQVHTHHANMPLQRTLVYLNFNAT